MPKAQFILPNWPAPAKVKAYTSCREGGTSVAPFASLNMAQHVGDNSLNVEQNRTLLAEHQNIVWLNQTHSTKCVNIDTITPQTTAPIQADASFCTTKNKVCAVMTADCLPILLCDTKGSIVAAIHAGWRGLADGIIQNTVSDMAVKTSNLMAWLGPAISQQHFEVGVEVKQVFADFPQAFRPNLQASEQKYFADLYAIARQILTQLGVGQVYGGEFCTYQDQGRFFSHRRATHQLTDPTKTATTGRMVTAIYIS
ncbi:peptidoglycan editing factor PgeF [Paraglaciecola aestuariivivens]